MIGRLPVVWDPHPRGADPLPGVDVVTPNEAEVSLFARDAEALRASWDAGAVCVTRGARGALLIRAEQPALAIAAPPVDGGDPCGAGDRFSAKLGLALADGADLEAAAAVAVACASEFVAAGGAGALRRPAPPETARDAFAVAERVRRAGGTLVATGGCFDLLHAGHLQTLRAARRLGDALVVCLNSDASVRRLKGPERPLVGERDRAGLLEAMRWVDAVTIFDEDTPEAVLERLRPHVWVKGGDYRGAALPEEATLDRWGGRAVLVPYVEGRSTTRLIEEAMRHA